MSHKVISHESSVVIINPPPGHDGHTPIIEIRAERGVRYTYRRADFGPRWALFGHWTLARGLDGFTAQTGIAPPTLLT